MMYDFIFNTRPQAFYSAYQNNKPVINDADLDALLFLYALKMAQESAAQREAAAYGYQPQVAPLANNKKINKVDNNVRINNNPVPVAAPHNIAAPQNINGVQQPQKQPQAKTFEQSKIDAVNRIFNDAVGNLHMKNVNKSAISNEVNKLAPGQTHTFNINGRLYAVSNENNSKIIKVARQSMIPFNGGGFGEIFPMVDIDDPAGKANILKLARNNTDARVDVLREPQILNFIHGNQKSPVAGIQAPPHKIVNLGKGKEQKVGYLARRYDMDGAELARKVQMSNPFSIQDKARITNNLLKGLEHIHAKGVYHGDIKLENTLWGDGNLVISDFGGAKKFSELFSTFPSLSKLIGAHTPNYSSPIIHSQLNSLLNNAQMAMKLGQGNKPKIMDDLKQKATALLKSNDKFAMGVSLFKMWTGKDPSFFRSCAPFCRIDQLQHATATLKNANIDTPTKMSILDHLIEGATPNLKQHYQQQRKNIMAKM
jgi:hypothetical protein